MKALKVTGIIFLVGFVLLIVAGPMALKYFVFRGASPEEVRVYREYQTKRVTIPEESPTTAPVARAKAGPTPAEPEAEAAARSAGLKPAPFAPATVSAAEAFRAAWEKYSKQALEVTNRHLPRRGKHEIDFAAAKADLAAMQPLIQAFETLVNQPGYDMSAQAAGLLWSGDTESVSIPMPNYLAAQTCAKLLQIRALSENKDGDPARAMVTAELIVRSGRGTGMDYLISQLIGVAVCSMGTQTWGEIVAGCKDPTLLRASLKRQEALSRQQAYLPPDVSGLVLDHVGVIRELNRRGLNYGIREMTARQVRQVRYAAEAEYYDKIVRPSIGTDPRQLALLEAAMEQAQTVAELSGHLPYRMKGILAFGAGFFAEPILYRITVPNELETKMRGNGSRVRFDLLRLATARRIWTLEHGSAPARMADLTPDLLPQIPKDGYATDGATYRQGAAWHSVGPDGVDQRGELTYDATNGTVSGGDIVVGR